MNAMIARTVRAIGAGFVALALSFLALRPLAEVCAILIRRQWPEAWFAGLIVWYADFVAIGFSIAIGIVVGRHTSKRY